MSKTSSKQKIEVLQGWLLQINRGRKTTKQKLHKKLED
jgi:hypothetical protein